jgi:hypothetical protein
VRSEPAVERSRLFTTHGTVLYVDPSSGNLRHRRLEESPTNAGLVTDGARGRLMYSVAGSVRPILCSADGCRAGDDGREVPEPVRPTEFELGFTEDGSASGLKASFSARNRMVG